MPDVGDVIDRKYRLDTVLGRGGYGVVFAATHLQLDHLVAIKFVEASQGSPTRARFLREARAAVRLQSEYIARVLDVGEADQPYMVLEYLAGMDLKERIATQGPMPIDEACECIVHACHALGEAHTRGIIHRDVKPANMMLTRDPSDQPLIKVLDFGISKVDLGAVDVAGGATGSATLLGTPQYMSPEQIRSSTNVDQRTDIWALGVSLFELLTGKVPFPGAILLDIMTKIVHESPPKLGSLRSDAPAGLAAVVARCLEKDATARYQHCGELALALLPFCPSRTSAVVDKVLRLTGPGRLLSSSAVGENTDTDLAPPGPQPRMAPAVRIAPPVPDAATAAPDTTREAPLVAPRVRANATLAMTPHQGVTPQGTVAPMQARASDATPTPRAVHAARTIAGISVALGALLVAVVIGFTTFARQRSTKDTAPMPEATALATSAAAPLPATSLPEPIASSAPVASSVLSAPSPSLPPPAGAIRRPAPPPQPRRPVAAPPSTVAPIVSGLPAVRD